METRENRWIRLKFIDQLMEAIMQRLGLIESRIPTEEEMAALQQEMANKISGPVEILSFDGNPAGRDTFEMPFMEGAALTFVKISDNVFNADDLAPATMTVVGADAIGLTPEATVTSDDVIENSGGYWVALGGMPQIITTAKNNIAVDDVNEIAVPSPGTYCLYVPEGGLDTLLGTTGSAPVYMESYVVVNTIPVNMLPVIPVDKLPEGLGSSGGVLLVKFNNDNTMSATFDEIVAAYNAGQLVMGYGPSAYNYCMSWISSVYPTYITFSGVFAGISNNELSVAKVYAIRVKNDNTFTYMSKSITLS